MGELAMKVAGVISTIHMPGLALVLAAVTLAGCAATETAGRKPPCVRGCVVTITVPRDPTLPASVSPEKFYLRPNAELNFKLIFEPGADPYSASVLLDFARDVFADANGNPVKSLPLRPGDNVFKSRPTSYRLCPPRDPCKYDVVVDRPEGQTRLDPWIIIER